MTGSPEEGGAPEEAGAPVTDEPAGEAAVSPKLLESLVCPATGGRLHYEAERGELVSASAGLAYPIRSGMPIMLIDEARRIPE